MEVLACGVNLHLALKHHQRWHRKEKTVDRTGASQIVGKRGLTQLNTRQDIDTGGRATLPVPGAVLEPPVLRQVAPRNARWRLRSRTCTLVVAGQITGLRTAGSELGGQAKGFLDRSPSLEGGSGHNTTSRFLGSDRKPCEPVATNCSRPPDQSLTSDKVNRSKCFLNATFLSFLIIFHLFSATLAITGM